MKKRDLAILCSIFAVVLVLGGVLVFAVRLYAGTGLSPVLEQEGAYDYNGKFLLSPDGSRAYLFYDLGKPYLEAMKKETIALDEFGFEGENFSYFVRSETDDYGVSYVNYYPVSPDYEAFWPVCTGGNFVYLAPDGRKFRIHPQEKLCYPMFADSIEGVDPYGKEVLGFSANASWAISLSGTEATLYHTDPTNDSLRIVETKKIDCSDYGETLRFGAFVGNTQCYLIAEKGGKETYLALSCPDGLVAPSALDSKGEYGAPRNRLFCQRLDGESEVEGSLQLIWNHLLLGTQWRSVALSDFDSGEICSVAPGGAYAVALVRQGERAEYVALNAKRAVSLSAYLQEGEEVQGVDFLLDNVILVHLKSAEKEWVRVYKICF